MRPRMRAGASSARYTQTCDEVTPTTPLIRISETRHGKKVHTRKTTDNSASNQMGDVLRRALHNGTDDPDRGRDNQTHATPKTISNETRANRTGKRARRHRRRDATLQIRVRVVEVVQILLGGQEGAHGRDIETEEGAAYRAKGSED